MIFILTQKPKPITTQAKAITPTLYVITLLINIRINIYIYIYIYIYIHTTNNLYYSQLYLCLPIFIQNNFLLTNTMYLPAL